MNGDGPEGLSGIRRQDPVSRFFVGCALVFAGLAAVIVFGALLIGWRLTRDEAPGRPLETFLIGDEGRYWSLDLKPQDAGLASLFARLEAINDATRSNVLRGTLLSSIPFPNRVARLDELAPFILEFATVSSDGAGGWPGSKGWAARATLFHGLFRMRAAFKVVRFVLSRDPAKGVTQEIDGIAVTEIHDDGLRFAVATAGNRVLVASDAARLRAIFRAPQAAPTAVIPDMLALHDAIKLAGEDAWAFDSSPDRESGAVVSFDVNERDELAFRVVVSGTSSDCSSSVSRFLPGVPVDAITIDGEGVRPDDRGRRECSGRIEGLSTRFADWVSRVTEIRRSETPFAIPIPPSLRRPVDRRSGTAAGPTHAGIPTPRR